MRMSKEVWIEAIDAAYLSNCCPT